MQIECAERTRAAYTTAQEALRAKQQASAGGDGQASSQHAQEGRWPLHGGDLPVFGIPGIHISLPTAVGPVSFSPLFLSKEQLDRTWVSCSRLSSSWYCDCILSDLSPIPHLHRSSHALLPN